jgi:hypothetical protein
MAVGHPGPGERLVPAHQRLRLPRSWRRLLHPARHRPRPPTSHRPAPGPRRPRHPPTRRLTPGDSRFRTAMRRGAAWPPAERPSSCVAVQPAVSRWQVPHRRAVMVAERRVCRPQQYWSPSQRCRGPGYPDAHRALVALSASTCPASARPVSGVRPSSVRRPVRVQRSCAWCPRVRCPVPGVRVQCERPASVSTLSAPVSNSSLLASISSATGTGAVASMQ